MGEIVLPVGYKMFCAIMYAPEKIECSKIEHSLIAQFGSIDSRSAAIEFTHSNYYQEEMGPDLRKYLVSFERLTNNEDLPSIKLATDNLEREYICLAGTGPCPAGRIVNLDPGYLTLAKVTLFTTKDYGHRIYLGRGIHCEVTLGYRGNPAGPGARSYEPLAWTYPDYKEPSFINFFNTVRGLYKMQLSG